MPGPESAAKSRGSGSAAAILLVLGVALIAYLFSLLDIFEGLEYQVYDLNFQFRGAKSVEHSDIAIVAIDEQTADSLSFPFNRKHYATLIRKLNRLGARLIVFDIQFSSAGIIPESDSLLKATIGEAGNVILAAKISRTMHRRLKGAITQLKPPHPRMTPGDTPWGLADDLVDADGSIRRYPLFHAVGDDKYFSLGLKTYQVDKGLTEIAPNFLSLSDLEFGDIAIPRSTDISSTLLNYYGPAGTFPTYSFISIIQGDYDFDEMLAGLSEEEIAALKASGMADMFAENPFDGKVVLVGASAEDLQDNKFTPFFTNRNPRKTPGVEVHANALQCLYDRSFIRPIGFWWIIAGVLLLSLLLYFAGKYIPQWVSLLAALLLIGGIVAGGMTLFIGRGLWLREMPLLLTIVLGYPTNLVYRFVLSQREKAVIRGMFGKYVPQKVADALIANPELAKLGGERRRMSVLFSDVAGFTTISEQLSPEDLVHLLNQYLTAMTQVIQDFDGIIDKYEGDLVMAEFGAPIWTTDHAIHACRAGLGMQRRLRELREQWRSEGRVELYSRVGINTGDMIIGNMGSEEVFDYTVMGDAVNLASRLEGANKNYGSTIMIGVETYKEVRENGFITRPLDLLKVKGKTQPVEVYELLAESPDELLPERLQAVELFKRGLEMYRERRFREAGEFFAQAMTIDPGDEPSRVYHERAAKYFLEPPPPEWDGVWTLTEK